jgi:septal ring-binding cell division protein DamX
VQPAPAAPAATPVADTTATPATTDAATPPPATDGATPPPADQPTATPATAAPAQPVAGDGVARLIVSIGGETTVTEWRDWTGNGAEHQLSKAVAYVGTPADLRDGAIVPVTVTLELSGNTSTETISRLGSLVLRVVAEEAPVPVEPDAGTGATPPAATETPPATEATPPATAPAEPATPPADGTATPPPPANP